VRLKASAASYFDEEKQEEVNRATSAKLAWLPWRDRDIDNDFTRLLISVDISTKFDELNIISGNYGMRLGLITAMDGLV
jgi:hypothetical protein